MQWVKDQLSQQIRVGAAAKGNHYFIHFDLSPTAKVAVFYSGGLDGCCSAHAALAEEQVDYLTVDPSVLRRLATGNPPVHEYALLNLASSAGYERVYLELDSRESEYTSVVKGLKTENLLAHARSLGLSVAVSRFDALFRHETMKWADSNGISYVSCFRGDGEWCGACFKCWHTKLLATMFGFSIGGKIQPRFMAAYHKRWCSELEATIKTKVDPMYGDCIDLVLADGLGECSLKEAILRLEAANENLRSRERRG